MRDIDAALKSRILNARQTPANNANPAMEVIVTRPRTPISDKRYWQETIITEDQTATTTSVAVRKTGKNPDKIYAAYISGGNLTVKAANVASPITNMLWQVEQYIPGCISCAVEFDGRFVRRKQRIEYVTESIPWLFYVTSAGALYGGKLGEDATILAASGVSSIDVVRGIRSTYGDVDQGLIVFYCYGGTIYYRSLVNGTWTGQLQVTAAPANVVAIKVERLFDYRICIQATDSAGALWEIFSKMEASGWNGNEFLSVGLRQTVTQLPITYYECKCSTDNITVGITQTVNHLYALSPVMVSANNIDDGAGNFGRVVEVTWDERIFGELVNVSRFVLTDEFGGEWGAQSLTKIGKVLTITFADFNNAIGPVTLSYLPGTLMGDVVAVAENSIIFVADGLVPTASDPPNVVSLAFPDQKHIVVNFDSDVVCGFWELTKMAFSVLGAEYDMMPDGELLPAQYEIDSVAQNTATSILITLTDDGRLKFPVGEIAVNYNKAFGHLVGPDGSQVLGWTLAGTPTITAPVYNPNDPEQISVGITQDVENIRIYYTDAKEDENISVGISQTVVQYHINDVPN